MSTKKRLFCAVKIPALEAIEEGIADFREVLSGERIKWVHPENLHLTLKFFGDTPETKEPEIINALTEAVEKSDPFSVIIQGCGTFGKPGMPRVIWLGFDEAGPLENLYHEVNKQLEPLGYKPDKPTFIPHLTIGRIKQIRHTEPLDDMIEEYRDFRFGKVTMESLILFESILKPQGPIYKVVKSFDL